MTAPLLEVRNLSKTFGGLKAVSEVSFTMNKGEILALLGPNGAGKTTAFNMIAGFLQPTEGQILFEGRDITGGKPWDLCREGIARTFQLSRPFSDLTVLENLMVGGFARSSDIGLIRSRAAEIAEFLGMGRQIDIEVQHLTAFDRRKLELGRALSTRPTLLLMDEVVAGATPAEAQEMVALVRKIRDTGVSILIVEHVMKVIMALSERVIVMESGRLIADGKPHDVVAQPDVLKAYFGEQYVATRA